MEGIEGMEGLQAIISKIIICFYLCNKNKVC